MNIVIASSYTPPISIVWTSLLHWPTILYDILSIYNQMKLLHGASVFWCKGRQKPVSLRKNKDIQILIVCVYVLAQVYLKQIHENNHLILWQEFKNEFGGKFSLLNAHNVKSYKSRKKWKHKGQNCYWIRLYIAALLVEMLLIMSGDVELNPGPLQGMMYSKRAVKWGCYKTWTVDSGLDHGLDYGPAHSRALVYAE